MIKLVALVNLGHVLPVSEEGALS